MRANGAVVSTAQVLVVRVGARAVAVPVGHVGETMRPLTVTTMAGAPPFVAGVTIIRGLPTPVVDVGALIGSPEDSPGRFVTIRLGQRQIALAVGSVVGVWALDRSTMPDLPPLLDQAASGTMEALGTLDSELLVLLRATSVIPDDVWQRLTPMQ